MDMKDRTSGSNKEGNTSWLTISCIVAVGAICVANNLILRSVKDATENLFNELASSTDPVASDDTSIKPKVWIAGKRVSSLW